jgi:uncharacterized membrane protein
VTVDAPKAAEEPLAEPVERLVFFSDAVIAIAMTLLILDLPLPGGEDDAARWRSFGHLLGQQYFTFALSFVVTAAYWAAHRRLFHRIARVGPGLIPANMVFLFLIVVLPYSTRLVGEDGRFQVGTVVYAATVTLLGVSQLGLLFVAHRSRLFRADAGRAPAELARGALVPLLAFAISIPIAFADVSAAKWSWLWLSVLLSGLARLDHLRRRRAAAPGPS